MTAPRVLRHSREVIGVLEQHYAPPPSKPPGGRLLTEIQAPTSARRADALYLPITTAGRGTIIGHEVKVTRPDVIQELRDPHKADSWMRYCSKWWLVIGDPRIIDGLDIPDEWGIMAPPTKGRFMTVLRKAPTLTPQPGIMAEAWGTIFARVAYADIGTERQAEYDRKRVGELEKEARTLRGENARLSSIVNGGKTSMSRVAIADVLTKIETLGGYGEGSLDGVSGLAWNIDAERVAKHVLAELRLSRGQDDLPDAVRFALEAAERTAGRLRSLLASLENQPEPGLDIGGDAR